MKPAAIKRTLFKRMLATLLLAHGALLGANAQAATRAWLDRDQVALGESATLNVETDQLAAVPDFSPLRADFTLSGQSSTRQLSRVNGTTTTRNLHQLNLTPRRSGNVVVPALQVGNERSAPLSLAVGAARPVATAASNAPAFLETDVDDTDPYVQQTVGITLRLFYAVPLVSGQLDLDAPDGVSMQRVGEDVQSARLVNGRRYNVVERRYLLVPDRSGRLVIPGARFEGRSAGGWIDDLIGSRRELNASGAPRVLEVRPQPADAPQPWLPLRDLRLRYTLAPQGLRAGEAASFVVEAVALGATQAQMPELPVPNVAGAQVFAEAPQYYESSADGSPQVKVTRRYSLVPGGAGKLVLPGMKLAWWDVRAATARTATLRDLSLQVAAGTGGFAGATLPGDAVDAATPSREGALDLGGASPLPASRYWPWIALALAVLWLATLAWALLGRRARRDDDARGAAAGDAHAHASQGPTSTRADLRRALDSGALEDVGDALRGLSTPPSADLDELMQRLVSPVQREAVDQLRRAKWADGDGVAARAALRAAFADGPQWHPTPTRAKTLLPPLYPQS